MPAAGDAAVRGAAMTSSSATAVLSRTITTQEGMRLTSKSTATNTSKYRLRFMRSPMATTAAAQRAKNAKELLCTGK
jgi:hypothetical protein